MVMPYASGNAGTFPRRFSSPFPPSKSIPPFDSAQETLVTVKDYFPRCTPYVAHTRLSQDQRMVIGVHCIHKAPLNSSSPPLDGLPTAFPNRIVETQSSCLCACSSLCWRMCRPSAWWISRAGTNTMPSPERRLRPCCYRKVNGSSVLKSHLLLAVSDVGKRFAKYRSAGIYGKSCRAM